MVISSLGHGSLNKILVVSTLSSKFFGLIEKKLPETSWHNVQVHITEKKTTTVNKSRYTFSKSGVQIVEIKYFLIEEIYYFYSIIQLNAINNILVTS